jgi:hypothetical protein
MKVDMMDVMNEFLRGLEPIQTAAKNHGLLDLFLFYDWMAIRIFLERQT